MATYEQLFPYIAADAPGVDDMTMTRAARDTVIDFCRRSHYWQQMLEPLISSAGTAEYDIDSPEDTVVVAVRQAWFDGRKVDTVNADDMAYESLAAEFGVNPVSGSPMRVTFMGNNSLILDPAPADGSKDIALLVALAPSRASTSFADLLFEEYAEPLGRGAASRLLKNRSLPVYDMNAALAALAEFNLAVNNARLKRQRGGIGNKTTRFVMRKEGK